MYYLSAWVHQLLLRIGVHPFVVRMLDTRGIAKYNIAGDIFVDLGILFTCPKINISKALAITFAFFYYHKNLDHFSSDEKRLFNRELQLLTILENCFTKFY